MNLNKLEYPMFKITLNEAFLLQESLRYLSPRKEVMLCFALDYVADYNSLKHKKLRPLKDKIHRSIWANTRLTDHMHKQLDDINFIWAGANLAKLRRTWVKKLLAHNGY